MKSCAKKCTSQFVNEIMHGERNEKKINENEFHFPHFTLAAHTQRQSVGSHRTAKRTTSMRRRGHYCAMYVRVLNDETVLDNGKAYLLYRRSSCFRQIISVILSHAANQRANEYAITMWMGIVEALSPSLLVGFNVQPRLTLCCVLRMFYIFHCLHGVSHSMSPCYAHLFVSIVFVTAYFVIHMYSAVCSSCAGVPLRTICKQCLHTRDARDFPETNNK